VELNRREFTATLLASLTGAVPMGTYASGKRTNILWLIGEDMGKELGCYGYPLAKTPNLDALAARGRRYENAFCTTPVCSPSRSAFNTGCYAIRTGAHQHRSHRDDGYRPPDGVRLAASLLREQGYHVSCGNYAGGGKFVDGKTDFNFAWDSPYQGLDWSGRAPGQPFFATINTNEPHRGPGWKQAEALPARVDPGKVVLPPYLPDDPIVRADFAAYLDMIHIMDLRFGEVLERLRAEGELENTLIFFFGDNGRCNVRGKQWCYDQGMSVPLIIAWPGRIEPGVEQRLVSLIDVTATTLNAASAPPPAVLDGRDLFDVAMPARDCVFASRDRCDGTRDRVRAARTARHKYIRNYMPERPYTQPNPYIDTWYPAIKVLRERAAAGTLAPAQALFMAPEKPVEELYDLANDPHEINNLAADPAMAGVLADMRARLDAWLADCNDQGALAEPDSALSK
jgi:N-sulfoglucosamine sulfohydrolase